jgi:sodium/potassium-transporting ATPase subunit alpha
MLVPGDLIYIKAGDKIPADIRIIKSNEMRVDNSSLTGESKMLLRTTECTAPKNALETDNLAFFGTICKEGNGMGIVINIGDDTVIG